MKDHVPQIGNVGIYGLLQPVYRTRWGPPSSISLTDYCKSLGPAQNPLYRQDQTGYFASFQSTSVADMLCHIKYFTLVSLFPPLLASSSPVNRASAVSCPALQAHVSATFTFYASYSTRLSSTSSNPKSTPAPSHGVAPITRCRPPA